VIEVSQGHPAPDAEAAPVSELLQLALPTAELDELDETGLGQLDELVGEHSDDLVGLLQALQRRFGFLPDNALQHVSKTTGVSLARLYGIATFYTGLSLLPRGKILIRVCTGTACHVANAQNIVEELESQLGVDAGQTTEDLSFTLETAGCLGCCSLAPAMAVDDDIHGRLNKQSALEIVKELAADEQVAEDEELEA